MSGAAAETPRVLHCHSSFNPGGKELRCVQLINAFGRGLRHSIVSGMANATGAAKAIKPGMLVDFPADFPALQGRPTPGRLKAIAQALKPYDLVLTYNWGAIDVVMAHTLFKDALGLPPLIHHEDVSTKMRRPGENGHATGTGASRSARPPGW